MDIIDELNVLEVLDSTHRHVGTGQSGRAVLTNLYNAALPLIRYEMGDYLVCGAPNFASPTKTIKEISGRTSDALPVTLRDGGEGAISPLVLASFYVPRLEKIQFVSLRKDRVRIDYVGAENLDRSIQIEFQRLLDCTAAARTTFEVCRAASIDPDPQTGKHRFVVIPRRPTSVAHVPEEKRHRDHGPRARASCFFDAGDRKSPTAVAVRAARAGRYSQAAAGTRKYFETMLSSFG